MFIDLEAVDDEEPRRIIRLDMLVEGAPVTQFVDLDACDWEFNPLGSTLADESPAQIALPDTVYMVICESVGGNEPGQVLSIWTDKEAAERERDELRQRVPINSAWSYEVNDAPLNKSGTVGLNCQSASLPEICASQVFRPWVLLYWLCS